MVRFDRYTGPPYFDDPELANVQPIFRSWRDFIKGSTGATLEWVVADISHRDFQSGLTYVAVSRAKTLNGIMFDASFDLNDIRRRTDGSMAARAADAARLAGQVVTAQEVLN
ncbi:hypothetical protein HRG_001533 [Hirsutella rhossiliensis]|uniref:Uncharacterized protein n=1 Tax=Hirsutella rhossiliensis TaxID=111463 RepID=A0A9P8MSA7_9HYPO|nr:uncharacterized protein HRG_08525 [Hirsutella rhossiliensis]XP_044726404.1 uncharacterized protein HRG_01533 [Hirsutella rhossiliensis]KAH0960370.1 hypothetical protein HRG_08525 [Hirsutella rhossiliensis]KAH0968891.1 hypothetical protein HRG_01533 [Hirsutella rhossiliensis]